MSISGFLSTPEVNEACVFIIFTSGYDFDDSVKPLNIKKCNSNMTDIFFFIINSLIQFRKKTLSVRQN
jgi:hypothetical protein